jgi:hypothetical protein
MYNFLNAVYYVFQLKSNMKGHVFFLVDKTMCLNLIENSSVL